MEKVKLIEVIPIEPLPLDSPDIFLYFSTAPVNKGGFVEITIKNKKTYGYIYRIQNLKETKQLLKSLTFQLKPIKGIIINKKIITSLQEKLAFWLAKNYCLSLPHAFYFFLNFFKKIKLEEDAFEEIGKKFTKKNKESLEIADLKPLPILILTPTEDHALFLYEKLKKEFEAPEKIIFLDLEEKNKRFNEIINGILKKEELLFMGSKNCLFLPWSKLNKIIVFEEGDIFYKEYFKSPYFNYLNIIEQLARLLKTELLLISNFPTLKTLISLKKPRQDFSFLKLERLNSIFELKKIIKDHKTIKIFSPLKIISKKLRCQVCFYEFLCPKCNFPLAVYENSAYCRVCFKEYKLENRCPNCNSNDIFIKGIGAIWIKRYLEKTGYYVWFLKEKRDIKEFLRKKPERYILLGSYNLLNPLLPPSEVSLFINFDQIFYSWNPFLKEKYLRIIADLAKKSSLIYIHTSKSEIIEKIIEGSFLKEILEERKERRLPPYSRLIKIISRLKNLEKLNQRLLEVRSVIEKKYDSKDILEVSGPFLEKIPLKKQRYQMFLILRLFKEIDLKNLLKNIPYLEEIKTDEEDI